MGQMDFISSIFVRFLFQNYFGNISLITRYICIGWSVPTVCASILIFKQWKHSDQYVYSCNVWSWCLYQKAFRDEQCNFWPGFNVHVQPGQCFLQSPLFCETANIWNVHRFVSIFLSQFYFGFKNKTKFGEINIWTAISSRIKLWEWVSQKCGLCIGYWMFCVGYRIYTRERRSLVYIS